MVVRWDVFDHRGEDKEISFAVYQTAEELVIKASLQGKIKPEEVNFALTEDAVTIKGESTFGKSFWKGGRKVREMRTYPVFTKSIPLDIPVDMERAKVSYGPELWTLTIPKKREER